MTNTNYFRKCQKQWDNKFSNIVVRYNGPPPDFEQTKTFNNNNGTESITDRRRCGTIKGTIQENKQRNMINIVVFDKSGGTRNSTDYRALSIYEPY